MARNPELSAKAQQQLGLPEGFKTWSPFPFGGMNDQASPIAMPDTDFTYVENFARLGDGNMRAFWDVFGPIYTAPNGTTVVWFTFYTIGPIYYCAVFLSDGSAVQFDANTLAQTTIGPAGTFYNAATGNLPYAKQWGSTYLLICNRNTVNDYWAWDGSILYGAGSMAPNGLVLTSSGYLYNSAPSLGIFGGSGSGIVVTPVIHSGSIVGITVLNPGSGYAPGDVVQLHIDGGGSDQSPQLEAVLTPTIVGSVNVTIGGYGYTSPPTVTISGGGGSGALATATIVNGAVSEVAVTNNGTGYTSRPTLSFSGGGGSGAVGYVDLDRTSVASVNVISSGTHFTGTPALSFKGGGGAGATATANMVGLPPRAQISTVTVSAGGSGYTSPPAVIVAPGLNDAAYGSITLMPYGVSGSAMETYLSRVWIINPAAAPGQTIPPGNQWSFSAPGSIVDFATSDGGGASNNTDSFLQTTYVNVRQSSGYLYFYGDGSVSSVSNVNTSGTPATTTFNYLNIDPQAGLLWRDSIQDFGKSTIIANETGIWGLFGGSLRKISDKLDQFLNDTISGGRAVYPSTGNGITPSSAIATIFNIKHYMNLMTVRDPDTNQNRNIMVTWNEKDWSISSQSVDLKFIATQKYASTYYAYGTDGAAIYWLFAQPSTKIQKRLDTKQYGADKPFIQKKALATYFQATDNSAAPSGISASLTTFVSGIPTPDGAQETMLASGEFASFVEQPAFPSPAPAYGLWGTSMNGLGCVTISVRFTSTSPDFTLGNLVIGYSDELAYYGA